MKTVFYTIIMILITAVQTTFMQYVEIFGIKPNLLLVFVVCVAIFEKGLGGGIAGLFCGITFDILGSGVFGFHSITYMYIGVTCGYLCTTYFRKSYVLALTFTASTSLFYLIIYYIFNFLIWGDKNISLVFIAKIIPECIYSTVVVLPMYYLIKRVYVRFSYRFN